MTEVTTPPTESRRINRFSLSLPIKVDSNVDPKVSWSEITRLQDVSAFGAGFNLKRPIKRGRLVMMTIPLPRQLRNYDYTEPQYKIWGLVRRCVKIKAQTSDESYALGVAFIGKHPPANFHENPAKLYDITSRAQGLWEIADADPMPDESRLPPDQRRHSRLSIPLSLIVEKIDEEGKVIASDCAVTENLSLGGAAIMTTIDADAGTFLRVTSDQYNVTIISVVRAKRKGADSIPRFHIEFIDRFFPLEGIE